MKNFCFFVLFLFKFSIVDTAAQEKVILPAIADSLKVNAYSVVRENRLQFIYESDVSGLHKEKLVLTVLNEKGTESANFIYTSDTFRELVKFNGAIYDSSGNLIRKMKMADLKTSEYTDELASDSKTYYYESTVASYPYTIVYEWDVKYKKGIIAFPVFIPQCNFNQSLENASFQLVLPNTMDPIFKTKGEMLMPKKSQDGKNSVYETMVSNCTAIENEPFTDALSSFVPILYSVPRQFSYDKTRGDMSDWKTFGLWQYGLLTGRDILPETIRPILAEISKNCQTDREKVKAVYDYLAKTSRYVSIQLGIGGLQPMPAAEVCRLGFGDCKGLSNYMFAMLKELGIHSVYTVISTVNPRLIHDFASANQMNHVILQVPLEKDTLWLECTNPQLPFGYIHRSIAGHDALLIKNTGGEVCCLPSYPDTLNKESLFVNIELAGDGGGSMDVKQNSELYQYEALTGFVNLDLEKKKEFIRRGIDLTQGSISNLTYSELKSDLPVMQINYRLDYDKYSSKTGSRLFVPVNIFRRGVKTLSAGKRNHPLYISYGYADSDTISFNLPDGYSIEALPKSIDIEQPFGSFISILKNEGGKRITVIQKLQINSGRYDTKFYSAFVNFWSEVNKGYANKIILKKME